MNRFTKYIIASTEVVLAGVIFSFAMAFIINGFQWNLIIAMNLTFYTGLLVALAGGIKNVTSFFNFKSKVKKTPRHQAVTSGKKETGLRWDYIFLVNGLIIFAISYWMAFALPPQ